ncbi:MAG TPA: hypothetical protein VGH92_11965 [Gaiellaceae bacterium]|jgi:hypothetical protein
MAKVKNVHLEKAQVKAKKQKRLAIVLCGVLGLILVYEVPHTMKLMSPQAKAPVVSATGATPAVNPQAATSVPLPAAAQAEAPVASTPTPSLVAAVQATPDAGQLTQFERFASKDPFTDSVQKTSGSAAPASPSSASSPSSPASPKTQPAAPKTPPAPPPTTAVISVNGELMVVTVNTDFPTSGAVFSQAGSPLFHLLSLTTKSAKVAIAGGSYADGAAALTLTVGKPVTLQNTADGTRYTLLLEPQGTQLPTTTTGTSTDPTSTVPLTSPSVVPPASGG